MSRAGIIEIVRRLIATPNTKSLMLKFDQIMPFQLSLGLLFVSIMIPFVCLYVNHGLFHPKLMKRCFSHKFIVKHRQTPSVVNNLPQTHRNSLIRAPKYQMSRFEDINHEEIRETKFIGRVGDQVVVKVMQFGPLGASVSILDGIASGLVLQSEIARYREKNKQDVELYDELVGYIGRLRQDGKVDVYLRPVGRRRIDETCQLIQEALEGSPDGVIPIGDKSSSEDISLYFHGVSKSDFKQAIGALFKTGVVLPGRLETKLITSAMKLPPKPVVVDAKPPLITKKTMTADERLEKQKLLPKELLTTIFMGNLPKPTTEDKLSSLIMSKFKKPAVSQSSEVIKSIRLYRDPDTNDFKGYGYIEFMSHDLAMEALTLLKGLEVRGRLARVDIALPRGLDSFIVAQNSTSTVKTADASNATQSSRGTDWDTETKPKYFKRKGWIEDDLDDNEPGERGSSNVDSQSSERSSGRRDFGQATSSSWKSGGTSSGDKRVWKKT